jgi:hypothetical protein
MPRQPAHMSIAQLTAELTRRQRDAKKLARTKTKLQKQLRAVETRLAILEGRTETPAAPKARKPGRPRKRRMSAEGRARIIAAQKARWAKIKAGKKAIPAAAKPAKKRRLSAAGLARIRAGVKARWAKVRAAKAAAKPKAAKPAAKTETKPTSPAA